MALWLTSYRKAWLRPDVVAGLTTAAVVIPKAMAYATIAGLPVQVGLYTAFLPMVIYAIARRGVNPVVNAISALIFVGFGALILLSERLRET